MTVNETIGSEMPDKDRPGKPAAKAVWFVLGGVIIVALVVACLVVYARRKERERSPWERLGGKPAAESTAGDVGKAVGGKLKAWHEEAARKAREVKQKVEEKNE